MGPPPHLKVNLCGNAKAGKTQLVHGWLSTYAVRFLGLTPRVKDVERTVGIDIHPMEEAGHRFAVWDYGGQREFQMLHHAHLATAASAVYVLVASLVVVDVAGPRPKTVGQIAREVAYWWRMIVSVVKHENDSELASRTAIVLTHKDLTRGKDVVGRVEQQLLTEIQGFGVQWSEQSGPTVCSVNTLTEARVVIPWLCNRHEATLRNAEPVPRLVARIEPLLRDLRGRKEFCTAQELFRLVENAPEHNKRAVALWLHLVGEIIWCEKVCVEDAAAGEEEGNDDGIIFLNPSWLCSTILGYVASSRALLLNQGLIAPFEDGEYLLSLSSLQHFANIAELGVSGVVIARLLEHFSLGLRASEQVFVPIRVTTPFPFSQRVDLPTRLVLGRVFRCSDPRFVFVPGFFPRLMLEVFKEKGAILWRDAIVITSVRDRQRTVAIIQAVYTLMEQSDDHRDSQPQVLDEQRHVERIAVLVYSDDCLRAISTMLDQCREMMKTVMNDVRQDGLEGLCERAVGPGCVLQVRTEQGFIGQYCLYDLPENAKSTVRCGVACRFERVDMLTASSLLNGCEVEPGSTKVSSSRATDVMNEEVVRRQGEFSMDRANEGIKCGEPVASVLDYWRPDVHPQQEAVGEGDGVLLNAIEQLAEFEASSKTLLKELERGRAVESLEMRRTQFDFGMGTIDRVYDKDVVEYGFMYERILNEDTAEIEKLAKMLESVPPCSKQEQSQRGVDVQATSTWEYLAQLRSDCKALRGRFEEFVLRVFEAFQAIATPRCDYKIPDDLKKTKRCVEKARLAYQNDFSRLVDILRCSFIFDTVGELVAAVEVFLAMVQAPTSEWKLVRVKNRFALGYDACASGGYRDLLLNVRYVPQGLVTEVQFHIREFFTRKHSGGGHKLYAFVRSLKERMEFLDEQLNRKQGQIEDLRLPASEETKSDEAPVDS